MKARRSKIVLFRLHPDEYEALGRAAEISGAPSLSDFLRSIVSEKARVIRDENVLLRSELEGLKAEIAHCENAAYEDGGRKAYKEGRRDERDAK